MIIRAPRPTDHYTVLSNAVLRDHRLSWKARGLLAFLLSMPDNWRTSSEHLARCAPDGRDSVRSGLRELAEHGYLTTVRQQNSAGQWTTTTTVHETPATGPSGQHTEVIHSLSTPEAGIPDAGSSGANRSTN